MKTLEELNYDIYDALKEAKSKLDSMGHKTKLYTNMAGNDVLSITVADLEGEAEVILTMDIM